jgi:Uma2 family endonuclease
MQVSENPKIHKATLADLLAIPEEDRRHEIIDGVLLRKEATAPPHGLAQSRLPRLLAPFDRKPGGRSPGGWWLLAETEIFLADDQIYRPDIAGWRRERLPQISPEFLVRVIPDCVCEILSTHRKRDLVEKKRGYHAARVGHYWIVDPGDETLTVHRWSADGYVEVLVAERGQRVHAEPFDAVDLLVGVLFGDDDDE